MKFTDSPLALAAGALNSEPDRYDSQFRTLHSGQLTSQVFRYSVDEFAEQDALHVGSIGGKFNFI